MMYKNFKGNQISTLGLGVMRLPVNQENPPKFDRERGQKIIDRAMELGINYFDTAHLYQKTDSETFLGEALKKYPRESYYLATKFYGSAKRDIRKTFFEQLERLQTDYVDFYLLHCLEEDTYPFYTDPERDYMGFLRQMRAEGRIRYLGFSTHASCEMLEQFLAYDDDFDMALMQLNFVDWELLDAKGQYEILTRHNIPVWVMEPLKGGRLATLNDEACKILKEAVANAGRGRATVFGYYVDDPERFGIVEFDENGKVLSVEEKPKNPKSNYALTGLYFYPKGVSEMAEQVKPSIRGELEITTLNEMYLQQDRLDVQLLGRGFAWLDTGNHDSLLEAADFVAAFQKRQGLYISCIEEIAYKRGFITKEQLLKLAEPLLKTDYGKYLVEVANGL